MRFYDLQKYLAETFKKNPDFFWKFWHVILQPQPKNV